MRTKFMSLCIVFMVFFLIAGCNNANSETVATPASTEIATECPSVPESEIAGELASGYTSFGFKLYSKLLEEEKDKNIFISPSSIALALSLTYNGAEKDTKDAMAEVLEFNGLDINDLNKGNQALINSLKNTDSKVELAIANSLWCNPDIKFKEDFIKRCQDYYFAEVSNEFTEPAINGWIKENTRGKIEKVIDEVPEDAILYLINAIYFKGIWTYEFDKEKTKEMDFHLTDGTKMKHPMMVQGGKFNYYRGENFQAVSLPYGDEKYSMYIFLPDEDSGLEEFQKNLTAENWEKWMKSFLMMDGDLTLPRFKIEYGVLLNDALIALGMGNAFGGGADFSGMSDVSAFISRVIHKTFVEVNEEGTEAAAVTVVEMTRTTSLDNPPPQRFSMKVDRPFFFAIRDNDMGTILFMGSVMEPGE